MKLRLAAILAAVLAVTVGCSDEVIDPGELAPELQPETMRFDFTFFDEEGARLSQGHADSTSHEHFFQAAFRVFFLHAVMVHVFAPPAHAFETAMSVDPVQQDDGSWLWSYSWTDSEERSVEIELQARLDALAGVINWELRVSDNQADPPLEDFVWFTGQSSLSGASGHWIFYDRDDPGTARGAGLAVVRLDWDAENDAHRSLVATLIDDRDDNVGDSISYALDATIVTVVYHDESAVTDADITWDRITGAGSLMWPNYNNGARACWDENQVDVDCPAPS